MPDFTIETIYHLPVFRHRTSSADTLEAACRAAIADDDWDNSKKDYVSCCEIHVTGIWEGADTAYARPPIQISSQFEEAVIRRAYHFEILLGLLKILFDDVRAARPPALDWLAGSARAIAEGKPYSPEIRILKSWLTCPSLPTSWSGCRRMVCARPSPQCLKSTRVSKLYSRKP